MKTMRIVAVLIIGSVVLQQLYSEEPAKQPKKEQLQPKAAKGGAKPLNGENICPMFDIDQTNAPDYWTYYGQVCPSGGADFVDLQTGLGNEACSDCTLMTGCGTDCVAYFGRCQGDGDKIRKGSSGPGIKLSGKNKPHKKRKLSANTANVVSVTDLSTLFVSFTPKGGAEILAQLYLIEVIPADSKRPPRIFGTGHEIDEIPGDAANPITVDVGDISPSPAPKGTSVFHLKLGSVEYQVITTPTK